MRHSILLAAVLSTAAVAFSAETYKVDPVHSGVTFAAHHAGAGYVPGRFNQVDGSFALDKDDLTKSTFAIQIPVDSVDTNNKKRDEHLKSPDWFNAKQYGTIEFKSTAVEKVDEHNLKVTGDLTLHGVTKSVVLPVELTGSGEFPPGTTRSGVRAVFTVKLAHFQIKGMPGAVGDEIKLDVMLEGTK